MAPDPADDDSLDLYARMVRRSLGVPVALVTLVEPERQVFPGAVGLPAGYQASRQTPLSHSFCQYVVRDRVPLVVSDAREVAELAGNGAIEDLGVVAYAGWPLTDHHGQVVGSLCAIDTSPHTWTEAEVEALQDIAAACSAELAERGRSGMIERALHEAERLNERSRALLALSESLSSTATLPDIAEAISLVSREQLGAERAGIWLLADPGGLDDHAGTRTHLTLVAESGVDWRSAQRFATLDLDATNPLGAALLDQQPLFFEDRDTQNTRFPAVANPDQISEARAFWPLVVLGRQLGVLVITWEKPRDFDDDIRATGLALAAYTSQAVQRAALLQERVDVSVTLQRAMLTDLPRVEGLELVARYLPAAAREQVGGDWYDALVLPAGGTMLAVGDVVGHDIAAAAVMGQLRSMLRGIVCAVEEEPSCALTRLDRAASSLGVGAVASAVLAHLEQDDDGWSLRWSSAGHLPVLVVSPTGEVAMPADGGFGDCLLGIDPARGRRDHELRLEPGSTLFLYTDGLVERRGEVIDAGIDRLRRSLAEHHTEPLDALVDLVRDDLVPQLRDDDVAVLAARVGTSR